MILFWDELRYEFLPENIREEFDNLSGMFVIFLHAFFYKTVPHVHYLSAEKQNIYLLTN